MISIATLVRFSTAVHRCTLPLACVICRYRIKCIGMCIYHCKNKVVILADLVTTVV